MGLEAPGCPSLPHFPRYPVPYTSSWADKVHAPISPEGVKPGDIMTSRDLLRLLDALDRAELQIDFAIQYLEDYVKLDPPNQTEEERREASETMASLRCLIRELVRMKEIPVEAGLSDQLVDLEEFPQGDELLNSEFSRRLLTLVPRAIKRWKLLNAPRLTLIPSERVSAYFKEAVGCYLHGFPVAATVLCRAVLEFAIAERIGSLGGSSVGTNDLVTFARQAGILSAEVADRADGVRVRGNAAVHQTKVDDTKALGQIQDTSDVLRALYRKPDA